jgi:hypothetical protein
LRGENRGFGVRLYMAAEAAMPGRVYAGWMGTGSGSRELNKGSVRCCCISLHGLPAHSLKLRLCMGRQPMPPASKDVC